MHDDTKSLGGIIYLQRVYDTFLLINDLYESPTLRIERVDEALKLSNRLSAFAQEGTIISFDDKRLILFDVFPVFLNNKCIPNKLDLLIVPIFDLSPYEQGEHYIPQHFLISISNWEFVDNIQFRGIDINSGANVTIDRIADEINLDRFEEWYKQFYMLKDWSLVRFITTNRISDFFTNSLRELHRI